MNGPLDGVKVIDFSEVIAGPLAGRVLAEMGAEVIKIEPPWGESWRLTQPFMPTESRSFITYNRGKRSLPLDLTKDQAQDILRQRFGPGVPVPVFYLQETRTHQEQR